jgi:hypothetical protein
VFLFSVPSKSLDAKESAARTVSGEFVRAIVECEPEPVACNGVREAVLVGVSNGEEFRIVPLGSERSVRPNGDIVAVRPLSKARPSGHHKRKSVLRFEVEWKSPDLVRVYMASSVLTSEPVVDADGAQIVSVPACGASEYSITKRKGRWRCGDAGAEQ